MSGLPSPTAPLQSTLQRGPRIAKLVAEFAALLPDLVGAIGRHASAGELGRAARLAHQLKGSAGGYGFPDIMQAAATVEVSARVGDATGATRGLEILRALSERARAGVTEAP